jgi:hypothetical protein
LEDITALLESAAITPPFRAAASLADRVETLCEIHRRQHFSAAFSERRR